MELELNGWKVKVALVALVAVVVAAPFARASMSNKGRADDWHRRAVVAEEAVGGLRVVIAERSRALNQRTLQANQLAGRLDSNGMALEKSKLSVGALNRRQRALATQNTRAKAETTRVTAERNKARAQLATAETLGRKLSACTSDLATTLATAKGKNAAKVAADAQPLMESCRKVSASFQAYLEKPR
jgi:hypothetical protein